MFVQIIKKLKLHFDSTSLYTEIKDLLDTEKRNLSQ